MTSAPVFEPDMDEKNKVEYKKIHDDYKNLVSSQTPFEIYL